MTEKRTWATAEGEKRVKGQREKAVNQTDLGRCKLGTKNEPLTESELAPHQTELLQKDATRPDAVATSGIAEFLGVIKARQARFPTTKSTFLVVV
jgi:hypothetical protein